MIRQSILTIQENKSKNLPRIWIEGMYLERAGFFRGCKINIHWTHNKIHIYTHELGDHIVSGKKYPIIDISNQTIRKIFNLNKIKVTVDVNHISIEPTKLEIKKTELLNDRSAGCVFSGGGLLDEAAKQAGYNIKWGIEVNPKYADIWQENHNATLFNADISDIDYHELEKVELLVAGIPCEPFSIARRNKDTPSMNLDLTMFFLMVVEHVCPKTIILEEVPAYIKSEIGIACLMALRRMGYRVESKLMSGVEYGEITIRKRAVIVATMNDNINFPEPQKSNHTMKDILEHVPDSEYFNKDSKPWIFDRWNTADEKGTNFKSHIITPQTNHVQAITKRYFAQQASNPVVAHPTKSGYYRWLTLKEVKKIMGLNSDYYLGASKTFAGEVMGQGVLVNMFRRVIEVNTSA